MRGNSPVDINKEWFLRSENIVRSYFTGEICACCLLVGYTNYNYHKCQVNKEDSYRKSFLSFGSNLEVSTCCPDVFNRSPFCVTQKNKFFPRSNMTCHSLLQDEGFYHKMMYLQKSLNMKPMVWILIRFLCYRYPLNINLKRFAIISNPW